MRLGRGKDWPVALVRQRLTEELAQSLVRTAFSADRRGIVGSGQRRHTE